MKNFKKLLVLCLALVMCVTALSLTSLAADSFSAAPSVIVRHSTDAQYIVASVVTDVKCGAVKGTITYPDTVTYVPSKSAIIEADATIDATTNHVEESRTITFVLVTKDLENGSDAWIDLYFQKNAGTTGDVQFDLSGVEACSPKEVMAGAISNVSGKTNISATAIQPLGGQYRKADGNVTAALRFGTKVARTIEKDNTTKITIEGTPYNATACGYLVGIKSVIGSVAMEANVDSQGKVTLGTEQANTMLAVPITKKLSGDNSQMIYSYALKNIPDGQKTTDICAKPYVVYKTTSGYAIAYGDTITRNYQQVMDAANKVVASDSGFVK